VFAVPHRWRPTITPEDSVPVLLRPSIETGHAARRADRSARPRSLSDATRWFPVPRSRKRLASMRLNATACGGYHMRTPPSGSRAGETLIAKSPR
jgi:hypothetical protein